LQARKSASSEPKRRFVLQGQVEQFSYHLNPFADTSSQNFQKTRPGAAGILTYVGSPRFLESVEMTQAGNNLQIYRRQLPTR